MAKMKLYYSPSSPYARKVKIVLYEKGIEFERISITPMTIREGVLGRGRPIAEQAITTTRRCLQHPAIGAQGLPDRPDVDL